MKLVPRHADHIKFILIRSKHHGLTAITATVGANSRWEKRTFTIRKDLLRSASKYFDKVVDGPFVENARGELELSVHWPMVFELQILGRCTQAVG